MAQQTMTKAPKRPRDINQWAKHMADIALGEVSDHAPTPKEEGKDPAAVSLGRRGGLKGGKARADSLNPEQRREIAQKAAKSRWFKLAHYLRSDDYVALFEIRQRGPKGFDAVPNQEIDWEPVVAHFNTLRGCNTNCLAFFPTSACYET